MRVHPSHLHAHLIVSGYPAQYVADDLQVVLSWSMPAAAAMLLLVVWLSNMHKSMPKKGIMAGPYHLFLALHNRHIIKRNWDEWFHGAGEPRCPEICWQLLFNTTWALLISMLTHHYQPLKRILVIPPRKQPLKMDA